MSAKENPECAYCQPCSEPWYRLAKRAARYWESGIADECLDEAFVTLTREQVLASGLLGPGPEYAETSHRLGDLIGLARGNHYLARDQRQLKMMGRHGGLSPREMLVPLLGVRLDAL